MLWSKFLIGAIALAGVLAADASAATRGLTVRIRESEAANAARAGEIELYSASHALVIGIDAYKKGWPRLAQARNDARAVKAALEAQGFEVTLVLDPTSDRLERALEDFFIDKGADPSARLFVWYAGHGYTDENGEGYLIPADGPLPSNRSGFLRTALPLRDFGKFVRLAAAKHVFTIFDSCFAGTIFNVARSAPPPQITRLTVEPARQFLTSGNAGQKVSDDGAFARLFIEALKGQRRADANGDTYLTASELGAFLDARMSNYTQNRQTPRFGALRDPRFDKGNFVFQLASTAPVRKATPRVPSGGATGGGSAEIVFWRSIEGSKDADSYRAYFDQYPTGSFAGLARLRIKQLNARKVAAPTAPRWKRPINSFYG